MQTLQCAEQLVEKLVEIGATMEIVGKGRDKAVERHADHVFHQQVVAILVIVDANVFDDVGVVDSAAYLMLFGENASADLVGGVLIFQTLHKETLAFDGDNEIVAECALRLNDFDAFKATPIGDICVYKI